MLATLAIVALALSAEESAPKQAPAAAESPAPAPPAAPAASEAKPIEDPEGGKPGEGSVAGPAQAPVPSSKPEEQGEEAKPGAFAATNEVNGYLDLRTQFTRVYVDGVIDPRDLPQLIGLVEANVQLKHTYAPRGFVFGDVSLFASAAGMFRTRASNGDEIAVADHAVPFNTPVVNLAEFYVSHDLRPELNTLLGKKRVVWGPGLAINPLDIMNPPRDPTDPSFQRTGAWMARVEVPLETMAFTLVFSPQVTAQTAGIPGRLLFYPAYDPANDGRAHYLIAARAYALLWDADFNLVAYFAQQYRDPLANSVRLGASFSRFFFNALELHFEGLGYMGSARAYPTHDCLTDTVAAVGCILVGQPILAQTRADGEGLTVKSVLGARYQLDDDTMFSAEYYFQSDGYTRRDLQSFVNAMGLVRIATTLGIDPAAISRGLGTNSIEGAPSRFIFDPLGKHQLFLTAQRNRIHDDFGVNLVVLWSLTDFSGTVSPNVTWTPVQWLTLTASGFIPFPGVPAWSAVIPGTNTHVGEYQIAPMQYRALLEARAFY